MDRIRPLPILVVLASILCLAIAPLPRAAAAAPVPARPASEWAAPWDTLSGPLDVPSFDYPRAIHDPLRHRVVTLVAGNPTQMWVMPLSASGPLAWTQVDIQGPMPPARFRFAAVYDSLRDRILVYGGTPVDTSYSDVWALSLAGEPRWSPVATLGTPPPRNRTYTMILDSKRDRLVVFGGQADSANHVSDLWELSLEGTPTWTSLSPLNHPPAPRVEGSAIYDRWHDRMVFFGGQQVAPYYPCESYVYDDTWMLNFSKPAGWWPINSVIGPAGRMQHTAVVDPEHHWMVVEGGHKYGAFGVNDAGYCSLPSPTFSDAWALPLDGRPQWIELPRFDRETGHYAAAYSPERGSDIVFSGNWAGTYELSLRAPGWSQILPAMPDTFPVRQMDATLLVDRNTGRLLMFGGGEARDLWSFGLDDSSGWRPEPWAGYGPFGTPSGNDYDPHRNRLFAFTGGCVPSRGETIKWLWDLVLDEAQVWSCATIPGPNPPGRCDFSLMYDPARDRVLIFGGLYLPNRTSSMLYPEDDLWSFSLRDSSWTQLQPHGTPGPRAYAKALYDARRDRMLLVGGCRGGYDTCQPTLTDTWELPLGGDSLVWRLVSGPGPVAGQAMLDTLRDRLLVLSASFEVWALPLAGTGGWQRIATPGTPPLPRAGLAATFDPVRDQLVAFGGINRADLYALRFSAPMATLESAETDHGDIALAWSGLFPGEPVEVQRAEADSAWATRASPTADEAGRITYEDRDFVTGRRYGYRLAVPGSTRHYDETWVTAPGQPTFGFRGAIPNPAHGALVVAFTLARGPSARLEIYDLAGRRLLTREWAGLEQGPYRLPVDVGALRPGVYLLRLVQGPHAATARAVVLK